jgi:maltose/maltodextrin transport system substrate-binding protein
MFTKLLCGLFVLFSARQAFAWTDGALLVWINGDKGYGGLAEVGEKFEKDLGIPVTVEHPNDLTDKFQAAAQSGKGPDIVFWANDRIREWADSGLLKPLQIKDDFKANFLPMAWDAVTHNKQIWGYPLALEAISLIYNKKFVNEKPPAQLSEVPALHFTSFSISSANMLNGSVLTRNPVSS